MGNIDNTFLHPLLITLSPIPQKLDIDKTLKDPFAVPKITMTKGGKPILW